MRDILLLRGIQGSGKSHFIEENDLLIPYTISSDSVRLLFQSPTINPKDNHFQITQKNDKRVWEFIGERVSEKMNRGEFIVIDAMNIDISKWITLAKYYDYRVHVVEFVKKLEECLENNKDREDYKYVPEDVIKSCYEKMMYYKMPKNVDDIYTYNRFYNLVYHDDWSQLDVKAKKLVFFGDIHGCLNPIEKYFNDNPYDEYNYYVFVGDYLDRGIQNKETLDFLIDFSKNDNVCFLEGNHNWERYYVNNQMDRIKSDEFLNNTLPQIESIDKRLVKEFIDKWVEYKEIKFNNQQFFISHAGFGKYPVIKKFISTRDYIKGNSYSDDVDTWWEENQKDIIQIHGHRNQFEYSIDKFEHSINLCEYVEFGECLRIVEFDNNLNRRYLRYKNDIFKTSVNPWKSNENIYNEIKKQH